MKPVRTRLKEYKRLASDSEKELIEYIQNHMDQVVKMSVHELAKEAYTSASTVIRLVKKIGFKGFKEFKQDLIAEITLRESTKIPEQNELTKEEKSKDIIDKITYRHIISIEETKSLIDLEVFETCIKLLTQAEQIYIFGIGASFLAAKDLQQKMMRVGKLSLAFEDYHLQILQARNMKPHDLAIVFSYSGQTEEMVKCSEQIKEVGATLISITRFGQSKVATLADHNLYIASNEPLRRSGAMTSRLAQLCMVDMLYLAYINHSYDQAYRNIGKTQLEKE
ncbi:MAG: MurR/RpiR family transcriptional regulator [Niameybacter sp.]|uniref:MurR/RpiR family transcriptional regulator n=1 Tax=Niameybacter sp. TaxID=2033640 RepID=UPI002FC94B85